MTTDPLEQLMIDRITRNALQNKKLIEVGWLSHMSLLVPKDVPDSQLKLLRDAYFSGAQHLFASIMQVMDPGEEATERDEKSMQAIADELDAFSEEMLAMLAKKGQNN